MHMKYYKGGQSKYLEICWNVFNGVWDYYIIKRLKGNKGTCHGHVDIGILQSESIQFPNRLFLMSKFINGQLKVVIY